MLGAFLLLLCFAAHAQAPLQPLSTEGACIEQWRANRGVTPEQLSQQTALSFIHVVELKAPASVSISGGCDRINVVLDKVRSDAASYSGGKAEVSYGAGDNQVVLQTGYEQKEDRLIFTGGGVDLSGPINQGKFNGAVMIEDKPRKLTTSYMTASMDNANSRVWTGTLTKAPLGSKKNDPIVIMMKPASQGMPLEFYLMLHLPATGAQTCGTNCGGSNDDAMQNIIDLFSRIFTAQTAWLFFDFVTPPEIEIYVDGGLLPSLQKEWPISPNKDHTVEVKQGSAVKWSAKVNLKENDKHHCPG